MPPAQDVLLGQEALMTADEMHRFFMVEFHHFPLDARRMEVRKVLCVRLKRKLAEVEEAVAKATDARLSELLRRLPDGEERRARATKLLESRDERMKQLKALPKAFLASFDEQWSTTELLCVYEQFWRELAEGDERYRPVLEATLLTTQKKQAAPEDLPALLLFARGLYGLPRLGAKHIVIDEAQDASPLQIATLRKLAGHDAFTLVGDLCQGVYGDEGLRSWDDLSAGVFAEAPSVVRLSVAYRSTTEIMNLAFAVIARHPVKSAGEAKPLVRHGDKPTLKRLSSATERPAEVIAQVKRWRAEGFGSVAVVVKTERAAQALWKAIAAELPEARITRHGDDAFAGGVQVMDASVVKGLEFDCALIADTQDDTYPDERFYAKLLYVLCTRPLHRLAMLAAGAPARHLQGCDELLNFI